MSRDLLVEIGTEELPPKALKTLYTSFADGIEHGLSEAGLAFAGLQSFGAPRRLAVLVNGLAERQSDRLIEKLGPNVSAAFDAAGQPTPAAKGFARSCGVALEAIGRAAGDKGERLVFRSERPGLPTVELVPGIVAAALDQLPIPKRMRWGTRRAEFVRPVHWLVMLFGEEVVPAELLGAKAGRATRGHRFHCDRELPLQRAADYAATLENDGFVIADFDRRRSRISAQVEALGRQVGGEAVIDPELLDEVVGLVEWPVALAGSFEARFLTVPPEALVSSMKSHQKYFHVVDGDGTLLPRFITVANIDSQDPARVVDGNERVIRPRLSDAAFFYETDLRTTLAERREGLRQVVFQKKLGSLYEKTERVAELAAHIAAQLGTDTGWARRAGQLSKADLLSGMVGEFDDMQGIAGSYYARHDGEPAEVAAALREQYQPRYAGDDLPRTGTGIAVALADRLDTLVGVFGIGQPPTGSKDPFALRRAALGVLRMIVELGHDLDLHDCLRCAQANYPQLDGDKTLVDTVLLYLLDRFRAWYEEAQIPTLVVQAVLAKQLSRPLDIDQRVQAVNRFSQLPEAEALAAANKRVSNILAKRDATDPLPPVDPALLTDPAEQALAAALSAMAEQVEPLLIARRYRDALEHLAGLRAPVDRFFDEVLVMAEEAAVRENRLALLANLRALFLEVADISLLAPAR